VATPHMDPALRSLRRLGLSVPPSLVREGLFYPPSRCFCLPRLSGGNFALRAASNPPIPELCSSPDSIERLCSDTAAPYPTGGASVFPLLLLLVSSGSYVSPPLTCCFLTDRCPSPPPGAPPRAAFFFSCPCHASVTHSASAN